MQLEIGKKYKTRKGRIVEIIEKKLDDKTSYPFIGDNSKHYSVEGYCRYYYNGQDPYTFDIISEVEENTSTENKVQTELEKLRAENVALNDLVTKMKNKIEDFEKQIDNMVSRHHKESIGLLMDVIAIIGGKNEK